MPHILGELIPAFRVQTFIGSVRGCTENGGKCREWIAFDLGSGFFYCRAHILKDLGCGSGDLHHFRINRCVAEILAPGDAPTPDASFQSGQVIGRLVGESIGIAGIRSCERLEQERGVANGTAHGARLGEMIGRRPAVAAESWHTAL